MALTARRVRTATPSRPRSGRRSTRCVPPGCGRRLEVEPTRPPQRLAPHAYALEAAVVDGEDDLADGRLVLLHDPAGHDAWQGTFRLVTLVRAELEPEMAADPLLPEVCWSWLTGALDARGLAYGEAERHGDARRFALLRRRSPRAVRPRRSRSGPRGRRARGGAGCPDTAAHLVAWCDLLCQLAGCRRRARRDAAVVTLPQRRGPAGLATTAASSFGDEPVAQWTGSTFRTDRSRVRFARIVTH